jgi:cellulose synthase/poly-beta-1,6-N-acetylglucosamine synthase-like glycosyltransferase
VTVSIGVFAHNEERRISTVLRAIVDQIQDLDTECELLVFSCASTDRTVAVAEREIAAVPLAKVISSRERRGKLAAIKEFGQLAKGDVAVICSADVMPGPGSIAAAVRRVAAVTRPVMVGMRVVTERREPARLVDLLTEAMWHLHHHVAKVEPKLGELVALPMSIVREIDTVGVNCDEVVLEYLTLRAGGQVVYLENHVVYNRAAPTLSGFLRQRRRIHCQHLHARRILNYRVSTSRPRVLTAAVLAGIATHRPGRGRFVTALAALALLEATARTLGRGDAQRGLRYTTWPHSGVPTS